MDSRYNYNENTLISIHFNISVNAVDVIFKNYSIRNIDIVHFNSELLHTYSDILNLRHSKVAFSIFNKGR